MKSIFIGLKHNYILNYFPSTQDSSVVTNDNLRKDNSQLQTK